MVVGRAARTRAHAADAVTISGLDVAVGEGDGANVGDALAAGDADDDAPKEATVFGTPAHDVTMSANKKEHAAFMSQACRRAQAMASEMAGASTRRLAHSRVGTSGVGCR